MNLNKRAVLRNTYLTNYSLKANQFTSLRYLFILTYAYAHYHITVKSWTTKRRWRVQETDYLQPY